MPWPQVNDGSLVAPEHPSPRYHVFFSRTTKIVEWDDDLFVDMRPCEADSAMDEHIEACSVYDEKDVQLTSHPCDETEATALAETTVADTMRVAKECDDGVMTATHSDHDSSVTVPDLSPDVEKLPNNHFAGKVALFVDKYGCDCHSVAVTEIVARLVRA